VGERKGLWSFSVGRKAYNRVTVYERTPNGPLWIQWWTGRGERHREPIKDSAGNPCLDRSIAEELARRASDAQAKAREQASADNLLGRPPRRTLGELLTRYHTDRESEWGERHRRAQRGYRAFWLRAFGADYPLPLSAATVEKTVSVAGKASRWGARARQAYLRYIVDAVAYGEKKLKWYGEADNLSAVSFPRVQSTSRPYEVEEMLAMLEAAPEIDLRVAAALNLAYDTQRRPGAYRRLKREAYRRVRGTPVIAFPGETDKAGKAQLTVISESTAALIEELLETKASTRSGYVFYGDRRRNLGALGALTDKSLRRMVRRVEALTREWAAEGRAIHPVPSLKNRAIYGVKHRAVTDLSREVGRRGVSKQSGVREETLDRHYDQYDMDESAKVAEAAERLKRKGGTEKG
jgi:hypothetical protein